MNPIRREFRFITCAFPHGAYQSLGANQPDLRAPSVKGQLRWWFDALFQDKATEDLLFGGLKNPMPGSKPGPESSRVIIRVSPLGQPAEGTTSFIPHKGQKGGEKVAILPGSRYQLAITSRRSAIDPKLEEKLLRCVNAWLFLGSAGQRSNRGAGSMAASDAPSTVEAFETLAAELLRGSKLRAALLAESYNSELELRHKAGDFLASAAFGGTSPFGSAKPRKPSPLKLRAVEIGGKLQLLALWDGRFQSDDSLKRGIETMVSHEKELGYLLAPAIPHLCR